MDLEALQRRVHRLEIDLVLCRAKCRAQKEAFDYFTRKVLDRLDLASMAAQGNGNGAPSSSPEGNDNATVAWGSDNALIPLNLSGKYPPLCPTPHTPSPSQSPVQPQPVLAAAKGPEQQVEKNIDADEGPEQYVENYSAATEEVKPQVEKNSSATEEPEEQSEKKSWVPLPGVKYLFTKKPLNTDNSGTDSQTTAQPGNEICSDSDEFIDSDDSDFDPSFNGWWPRKRRDKTETIETTPVKKHVGKAIAPDLPKMQPVGGQSAKCPASFNTKTVSDFDHMPTASAKPVSGTSSYSQSLAGTPFDCSRFNGLAAEDGGRKPFQFSAGPVINTGLQHEQSPAIASGDKNTSPEPRDSVSKKPESADVDQVSARLESTKLQTAAPTPTAETSFQISGLNKRSSLADNNSKQPITSYKETGQSPPPMKSKDTTLSRADYIRASLGSHARKRLPDDQDALHVTGKADPVTEDAAVLPNDKGSSILASTPTMMKAMVASVPKKSSPLAAQSRRIKDYTDLDSENPIGLPPSPSWPQQDLEY